MEVIVLQKSDRGLGISIRGGTDGGEEDPCIYVQSLQPNRPAALDGRLQPGDRIIQVNEHVLNSVTHGEAVEVFKQSKGAVRLTILRNKECVRKGYTSRLQRIMELLQIPTHQRWWLSLLLLVSAVGLPLLSYKLIPRKYFAF